MPAQSRVERVAAYRPVCSRFVQQVAIDARAGHVVDIERVWPADANAPAFHRFVCTCGLATLRDPASEAAGEG